MIERVSKRNKMRRATRSTALPIETLRLGSLNGFGKELVLMLTRIVTAIKNGRSRRASSKIKYYLSLQLKRKSYSLTSWKRRTRMVMASTLAPIP